MTGIINFATSNSLFVPLAAGVLIVLGLMGLGVWQLVSGWPLSRKCPVPECSAAVIETATKVEILETNQAKIFSKVSAIADDVSFIRGKMDDS